MKKKKYNKRMASERQRPLETQRPPVFERDIDFSVYHSPYEYRYSTDEMREIWSENHKLALMRDVWVAVAGAQNQAGLVTNEEYQNLVDHRYEMSYPTVLRRELDGNDPGYTGHDVVAAISDFADRAEIGGGKIHQGLTSEDVLSNVEVMQMKEALSIIERKAARVLEGFGIRIEEFKGTPAEGYTHLQAAEPITVGHRLSNFAQDFLMDLIKIRAVSEDLKGKGIKGPVGTSGSVKKLLEGTEMTVDEHEDSVMDELELDSFTITNQTYPRKQFAEVMKVLSGLGTSSFRFGNNMRLLQFSQFDEMEEPRAKNDVGSSAMPHKHNPRHSEAIMGLARGLKYKAAEAEEIASQTPLERGIDDSSGRRSLLPEAFLAVDEILTRADRIVRGMDAHPDSIWRNLERFAAFTATEQVMGVATRNGANRQEIHEELRKMADKALVDIRSGKPNPLRDLAESNAKITAFVTPEEIAHEFEEAVSHTGEASRYCEKFLKDELYPAIGKAD